MLILLHIHKNEVELRIEKNFSVVNIEHPIKVVEKDVVVIVNKNIEKKIQVVLIHFYEKNVILVYSVIQVLNDVLIIEVMLDELLVIYFKNKGKLVQI